MISSDTIRLKPRDAVRAGEYSLDAVVIQYDADADRFTFRLELSSECGIYRAFPAERNGRLRLIEVVAADRALDEPVLVEDPWVADVDVRWEGNLGWLTDNSNVLLVSLEITAGPPSYRCTVATYWGPYDLDKEYELSWRGTGHEQIPPVNESDSRG